MRPCSPVDGDCSRSITAGYRPTTNRFFFFSQISSEAVPPGGGAGTDRKLRAQHLQNAGTLCIILIKSEQTNLDLGELSVCN